MVLEGLARLDDVLDVVTSVAGLHVCAVFGDRATDDRAVVARAAARGVRVDRLSSRFRDCPPRPGLAVGFGGIDADALPDAMRRLEQAVRS
jgi:GntR family transcriptional regulator/MocR family aminotransferase